MYLIQLKYIKKINKKYNVLDVNENIIIFYILYFIYEHNFNY